MQRMLDFILKKCNVIILNVLVANHIHVFNDFSQTQFDDSFWMWTANTGKFI